VAACTYGVGDGDHSHYGAVPPLIGRDVHGAFNIEQHSVRKGVKLFAGEGVIDQVLGPLPPFDQVEDARDEGEGGDDDAVRQAAQPELVDKLECPRLKVASRKGVDIGRLHKNVCWSTAELAQLTTMLRSSVSRILRANAHLTN
jgi:hypothetical protein